MPIDFTCPHCGVQTNVADEYAGQSGVCVSCGRMIMIPTLPAASTSVPPPAGQSRGQTSLMVVWFGVAVILLACGGLLLFLPAVNAPREAGRRSYCANNLKQIGLAMHNYQDQYGCLPPAYLPDKDGKPMHSWRVLLLPYLDLEPVYAQYRFDEPWDGPNNRALMNRMSTPPVYRCPSDKSNSAGTSTNYVVITGPGTVFEDGKSTTFRDIKDGLANTLMVVEIPGAFINWMEPKDTTSDGLNRLILRVASGGPSGLRGLHPGGFNAVLCDGSVRFISFPIAPETLKLLIEKSNGQATNPGQWQ